MHSVAPGIYCSRSSKSSPSSFPRPDNMEVNVVMQGTGRQIGEVLSPFSSARTCIETFKDAHDRSTNHISTPLAKRSVTHDLTEERLWH